MGESTIGDTLLFRVRAHSAILNRGLFGRLKWLLFGR